MLTYYSYQIKMEEIEKDQPLLGVIPNNMCMKLYHVM